MLMRRRTDFPRIAVAAIQRSLDIYMRSAAGRSKVVCAISQTTLERSLDGATNLLDAAMR